MPKDAIPAIPSVPPSVKDPQLRSHLQALKDTLQTRAGQTKNRLDYSPTVRELEEAGILKRYGGGFGKGGTELGPPDTGRPPPYEYPTIPLAPTGVTVRATPWYHHVTWDLTTEQNHYISDHAEVWTAEVNDREQAWMAGIGMIAYSVPVEPLAHRWYWVRYMSHAGVEGYWSNERYDGVEGISPPDPESLRETLSGAIRESELYETLNERLDYYGVTVDATQNQYAVKINNDGNIAGFGLIVDGEDNYDPLLGHSQFGVSADTFWIGAPGAEDFTFIVDTQNQRVVMDGAFIAEATITGAAIGDAAIDTFHLGDGTITTVKIEDGAVEDAKIGNTIRSYNYDPGNGIGWLIDKNGFITAGQITILNDQGEVILQSGPGGAAYHKDIDNENVTFENLSDVPDYLERAALLSMSTGGYGDMTFEHEVPQLSYMTVHGSRFYASDGTQYAVNDIGGVVFTGQGWGWQGAAFLVFISDGVYSRFSGWDNGSVANSTHICACTYDNVLGSWKAWDMRGNSYQFTPKTADVILGTFWKPTSNSNGVDSYQFTSFIGVNLRLPDDGATRTGHDNLVLDGDFVGLDTWIRGGNPASGSGTHENPWWYFSRDPGAQPLTGADARVGRFVKLDSGSAGNYWNYIIFPKPRNGVNATPSTAYREDDLIKCVAGESLFWGCQFYLYAGHSTDTNALTIRVQYYDNNFTQLEYTNYRPPVNNSTYPSNVFNFTTGVTVAPAGASYCRIWVINFSAAADIAISFVGLSRQPQRIGKEEAATYIKDAAIGTLQLAGNSVFLPSILYSGAQSDIVWRSGETWYSPSMSDVYPPLTGTSTFMITMLYFLSCQSSSNGYPPWYKVGCQAKKGSGSWQVIYESTDPKVSLPNPRRYVDYASDSFLWTPGGSSVDQTISYRMYFYCTRTGSSMDWFPHVKDLKVIVQAGMR